MGSAASCRRIVRHSPTDLEERSNTALQTDDRRATVCQSFKMTFAPLAAERQNRWADCDYRQE
jgi:hypothetical protein